MLFTAAALSSLSLIATLSSTVAAHGSHNSHQHLHHRQAADGGPVILSGSRAFGDGQIHSRLEASDMFENRPDQWTLLILAMEKFQSVGASNLTSYYAISSIHGVPREEWDGVAQCDTCDGADGYCTHDSVLFPAWHRAYTALFEQEFLKIALDIANSYPAGPLKDRMLAAVQTLRWPYWDWAARPEGDHCLPAFLSQAQITITGQNGQQTIDNPLVAYKFADPSANYYGPFNDWQSTLRYPNSDNADAISDEQAIVNAFDDTRETLQDQVYSLLANCDNYLYFSNDAPGGTYEKCANSLEQIHNSVHTSGGGPGSNGVSGGHLTYLPIASFDPIFWFLHCNTDRLFALWQTIYPNSYGATQQAPHHTWTIAEGSTQGIDSDLTPFRDTPNSFWTTRKVQDWAATFGYTYPEFASTDGSRGAIIEIVNALYGPNSHTTAAAISKTVEQGGGNSKSKSKRALQPQGHAPAYSSAAEEDSPAPKDHDLELDLGVVSFGLDLGGDSPAPKGYSTKAQPSTYSTSTPTAHGSLSTGHPTVYPNMTAGYNNTFTSNNGSTYEYMCHFQSPRYTLNGSYVIYAFDGTPESDDSSTWNSDVSCIGSSGSMAGGDMAKPDIISYGGVPMTRHLQKRCTEGKLKGMDEKHALPYLQENLEWKIVRQGEVIHPDDVPNFQASVYSGTSSPAGPNSLGSWNSYTPQVEVTKNKAGGAKVAPVPDCPVPGPSESAVVPAPSQPAAVPTYYSQPPAAPAYSHPAAEPVHSQPAAVPYPAPNGTVPGGYGYPPAGTGAPSGTGTWSTQPATYTGGAGKPAFQIAGLLAAAGLVAVL